MPIIKQIKQKTSENDFTSYPIGADSQNINMKSTLDLQEELKLGSGNKQTVVSSITTAINDKPIRIVNIREFYGQIFNDSVPSSGTSFSLENPPQYTVFTNIYDFGTYSSYNSLITDDSTINYIVEQDVTTNPTSATTMNILSQLTNILASNSSQSYQNLVLTSIYSGYQAEIPSAETIQPIHQKLIKINTNTNTNTITETVG